MKRSLAIFLLLALFMSACSHVQNDPQQTSAAGSASTAGTTAAEQDHTTTPQPMMTVSVPAVTQESVAEDGTLLCSYTYQRMSLIMPDPEVADKIIIDFLNRVDSTTETANAVQAQASEAYKSADNWIAYMYNITYSPMRIDQNVLSLYGNSIQYTGGAHPEYSCRAANYDMVTGHVLTLGSILESADSVDSLCTLVTAQLDKIAQEKYLRQGFEEVVQQRFAREESYDEDWFFTTSGLCFYFAPYEIAPYSSGVILAEVPYADLSGILADVFFPTETDVIKGDVEILSVTEADLNQFTRISEVIIDKDIPAVLLYTNDSVQHLSIIATNPDTNTQYTVFAAHTLVAGDAIMIEAAPETLGNLTLVYENNGTSVSQSLA